MTDGCVGMTAGDVGTVVVATAVDVAAVVVAGGSGMAPWFVSTVKGFVLVIY